MPRDHHQRRWARASADDGLSVVEVMVAITLLAFMMTAVASGIVTALRATELGAERTAATQVATRIMEVERARDFSALLTRLGTNTTVETLDDRTFDVTVTSSWVGVDVDGDPCEAPSGVAGDPGVPDASSVVRVEIDVDPRDVAINPVHVETVIAPPGGTTRPDAGTLIVEVKSPEGEPVPLALVEGMGASNLGRRTTGANGCVVFGNADPGDYDVAIEKAGWVGPDDEPVLLPNVELAAQETQRVEVVLGQASSVRLSATSVAGGALPSGGGNVVQVVSDERRHVVDLGTTDRLEGLFPSARRAIAGGCPDADPDGADDDGDPIWNDGQRGDVPITSTPLQPGGDVLLEVLYASVELELHKFGQDENDPDPSRAVVVATNDDDCPGAVNQLRWELDAADAFGKKGDRFLIAMPFGRWNFQVVGTDRTDDATIRPRDWDTVQSARAHDHDHAGGDDDDDDDDDDED